MCSCCKCGQSGLLPLHFAFCLRVMFWGLLHSPPAHPGLGSPGANPQWLSLPSKVELCN